ncbi:MAG: S8 family serine peptidase [Planctomycetota bacterium]
MRSYVLISLLAIFAAVTEAPGSDVGPAGTGTGNRFRQSGDTPSARAGIRSGGFRQDRILVKPKANTSLDNLHVRLNCTLLWQSPAMQNLQIVKLPAGANVPDTIVKYMGSGLAEYAEPDYEVRLTASPDDPLYANGTQWALHNTGDNGGIAGADIHAPEAWDIRSSAANVIVALVDSGIRLTHEDLAANLWVNPGVIPGTGTDDVNGINTVDDSGDVNDDFGHGTHVAGIIGAAGNNGKGISGVAWSVQLMACKAFDSNGSGSVSTLVKAIDYARAHGAAIINNSYGVNAPLEAPLLALKEAIAAVQKAGIIFVVAAGNEAIDNDQLQNAPSFPASFGLDNIVSVTSTNRADGLSTFSNYGLASVDLGAPGEDIVSTYYSSDTAYVSMTGTSMSAPLVSGALALMKAQFPDETYLQLYNRVFANTDPLPALQGLCRTGGRLNLYKALASTSSRPLNDDFSSAITVSSTPFQVSGINVSATKEAGEPNHAGDPGGASVWWSWTAPSSGNVLLSTAGSTFSTLLGVYTGSSVGQLTAVASGNQGTLVFAAVAGTNYHLAVDGAGGATGSILLSLQYPPLNDDFANATVITSFDVQTGSNVNATKEPNEPNHAGNYGGKSVWWQWTPANPAHIAISTQDSAFDTVLAVYTGSALASLTEVASNNDEDALAGIVTSRVEFDAVAGTTYWIAVDGFDGASGNIRLHLQPISTTVRIFATTPWASKAGPTPGTFTVTRTGSLAADLAVNYSILSDATGFNGLAVNGTDFVELPGTVTIPAGSASAAITVTPIANNQFEGTTTVALQLLSSPDYALGSQNYDVVHILDNQTFSVTSALSADTNPCYAGSEVSFTIKVNSSAAEYIWDFGDGTTTATSGDAPATHAFSAAGTYTVTVQAIFPLSSVSPAPQLTETILLQVNPPLPLDVTALQLTIIFSGAGQSGQANINNTVIGNDRLFLRGSLSLPKNFVPAGAIAQIGVGALANAGPDSDAAADAATGETDAGPVFVGFSLNKLGSSTNLGSAFRLFQANKSGVAQFTATLSHLALADVLDDEGLVNGNIQNKPVKIPVTISLGKTTYYAEVQAYYSAKAGKKGWAKK